MVLGQFQQDEVCCFTLATPHKVLIVGKDGVYKDWLSNSKSKWNAVAMYLNKHILHISKTHNALIFEHSLYKVDGGVISPLPFTSKHNYTCVCVTFQVEGENTTTTTTMINFSSQTDRVGRLHLEVFLLPAKRFVFGV